jgi:hypothetical protein
MCQGATRRAETPPEGHKEHSVHGGVWTTVQGGCYVTCARRGSPASV